MKKPQKEHLHPNIRAIRSPEDLPRTPTLSGPQPGSQTQGLTTITNLTRRPKDKSGSDSPTKTETSLQTQTTLQPTWTGGP